jgi:dTDP-4-amino-4,6-dideoxygalactose transaminase
MNNVNVGMSAIGDTVMARLDYPGIRERRRANFMALKERLNGRVRMLRDDLPEGVCPLFFPILVNHKSDVARRLWARGIGAVDFWNDPQSNPQIGADARFLRAHVLELPIHQDVRPEQVDYIADEVIKLRPEPVAC